LNHRGAETQSLKQVTEKIIGGCIAIHKALGPCLLESVYEECLCHEMSLAGLKFERQKPLRISYRGIRLDCGYRLDLIVEDKVIVELKTVEALLPIHEAQLLTYLKLCDCSVGLLINFNVPVLVHCVKRIVNGYRDEVVEL